MAKEIGPKPFTMPDRIAVDADGFGWRVWNDQEHWSMVPTNPDNEPIPQPVTWFVRQDAAEEHQCQHGTTCAGDHA